MDNWKQEFANEAEKAFKHPRVVAVVDELLFNLQAEGNALVHYGIMKVANAVAQVARAQALGIDVESLRPTAAETAAHFARIANIAMDAGKLVMVVVPSAKEAPSE